MGVLGFLQRIWDRKGGVRVEEFGENLEERARRYLGRLSPDSNPLAVQVTLHNLRWQSDLFDEEAITTPEVLDLQIKVFQLALHHEAAQEIAREFLSRSPISKLFSAIIQQAKSEGHDRVRITFPDRESACFPVHYITQTHEAIEAMTIPMNLAASLRGFAVRLDKAGYEAMRPFMYQSDQLPATVRFDWSEPEILLMGW